MKNNLLAVNCPATKIKEYLKELINIQVEYILNGEIVPKKYLFPSKFELSKESFNYLINSSAVTHIGANNDEFELYCDETDKLPSLIIKIKKESDKYYLTYLKEDNISNDYGIVWDANKEPTNKGEVFVYKTNDNTYYSKK